MEKRAIQISSQQPKNNQKQQEKPQKSPIQNFKVSFLKKDGEIEQAAKFYTESFLLMNSVWMHLGATFDEVYSVNRGRLLACAKAGWACVGTNPQNNDMLLISANLDLVDYLAAEPMPNNSIFLKTLGKYGAKLQKEVFQSLKPTLKRGHCIYNYGGAVRLQFANGRIGTKFSSIGLAYFRVAGYKVAFFRATNKISSRYLLKYGAKLLNSIQITEPGLEGEVMELFSIDLDKISFESLTKYYEDIEPEDQQQD